MQIVGVQKYLLDILIDSQTPLSAQYMANRLGISSKTVRTSLESIREELRRNSVSLVVHPGIGYQLTETSENAILALKEKVMTADGRSITLKTDEERAHYLIRQVLTSNRIRTIDDIADLFYINSTSAKHILSDAREILNDFSLKAVFHKKGGLQVSGTEKDIRFCLAYEESYYHRFGEHDDKETEFAEMLGIGTKKRSDIEEMIKKYQNTYEGYNLSSYSICYISALFCESVHRNGHGHLLKLTADIVDKFTDRNTYYVAKMIVADVEELYGIRMHRDDVILITMALVSLRVTLNTESRPRDNYLNDKDMALEIVQFLSKINQFQTIGKDILLVDSIAQNIRAIMTRNKYHIITSQFAGKKPPEYSLMALKMAVQTAEFIESKFGIKICREDIIRFSYLIYPVFGRFPWKFPHEKALVVSAIDKNVGCGIRERLLRNFSAYLGEIDVFESYELENTDLDKYEFIFTDLQEEQYRTFFPSDQTVIPVHLSFNERDKVRIRTALINGGKHCRKRDMFFTQVKVISLECAKNREDCLRAVAEYVLKSDSASGDVYEDLKNFENHVQLEPVNNTIALTGCLNHTEKAQVYVFILPKAIVWQKRSKVKVVFYWDRGNCLNQNTLFENEYVPHLLDLFRKDAKLMEEFLNHPAAEQIIQAMLDISNHIISNSISFI